MADRVIHKTYQNDLFELAVFFGGLQAVFFWWLGVPQFNPFLFFLLYPLHYYSGNVIEPDGDQIGLTGGDGDLLRWKQKGFILGFLGLLAATWNFWYAWIMGWFGGHRNPLSHGWGIGTFFRVIWWNIPVAFLLEQFCVAMGWLPSTWWYELYAEYWVVTYFMSQYSALFLSDAVHLILDTEWAKGNLYIPANQRKKNTNAVLIHFWKVSGIFRGEKGKRR